MQFRQGFRCFPAICGVLFFIAPILQAQSLEDLEKQILYGESQPQAPVLDAVPPAQKLKTSKSDNQSAGQLLEEFAKEDEDYVFSSEEKDEVRESALEAVDEATRGPKQIPFEHIFVVKNQYIDKASKFEIAPITLALQPGDSFRKQLQVGFSLGYHLNNQWAIEFLHFALMTNYRSTLDEDINAAIDDANSSAAQLGFRRVEPVFSVGASMMWSPFTGKSSTIENIYHFEGYFLLGGGGTRLESSFTGMAMFGGGLRLFLNKRAILKFELRDYYDFDSNAGHRVNFIGGASVLIGGES